MTQEQKKLVAEARKAIKSIHSISESGDVDGYLDNLDREFVLEFVGMAEKSLDALEADGKTTIEQTNKPEYGMCVKCGSPVGHVNGTKYWPEKCPGCGREIEETE